MNNKRFIVAGGAGFLGANLCHRLLAEGAEVLCVDSLLTGRRRNILDLLDNEYFALLEHDIIEPFAVDGQVDGIFNLACAASPPRYQADPVHTFRTSIWGNWNLAQLAMAKNTRLLFSSTSEVYGDPDVHPQPESYFGHVNPVGIRSCYDEGKRGSETLLVDLARTSDLDVRIMRIFNTYGPHMDYLDGRVVSNFIVQGLRNEALTMYGDGSQTRSFCYVDDLIEGMVRLFGSDESLCAVPVNIGNPEEFTLRELAAKVEQLLGETLRYEYHPLPSDDPKRRRPDISRARAKLGWEPSTSLVEGLVPTVAYFREELKDATGF